MSRIRDVLALLATLPTWAIAQPKEQATLKGHAEWVRSLAYNRDGKTLVSGSADDTIKLWDVSPQK